MKGNNLYDYKPLVDQQIRIIQFLGEDDGIIHGNIKTIDLRDDSCPPYRALSYVWSVDGKPIAPMDFIDTWYILVENQRLPILESLRPLFEALKVKDSFKQGTWWWIDCACINQQDNREKGHQVPLMGLIYELAEETIIWLGEESFDSNSAMDYINFLHELLPKTPTDQELQKYLRDHPEPAKWKAVQNLLLRRWWTRVWTVQEYALAANVSFWCGQKSATRVAVSDALFVVDRGRASGFDDTDAFYISWNRRRVQLLHECRRLQPETFENFPMSVAALAAYTSNNEATNDRDRLYSLCGLATDMDLIEVDYDISVDEAYLRFAQKFITKYKSLDIICFAHHYVATSTSSLPSWVPDWRRKVSPVVVPTLVSQSGQKAIGNLRPRNMVKLSKAAVVFSASGNLPSSFEFQNLDLIVQGKVVEVVDGLGASKTSSLIQPSDLRHPFQSDSMDSAQELMIRICKLLVFDREDRYLRYRAPIDTFVQEFESFCFLADSAETTNLNHEFKNWFERNRSLQILGHRLDSIARRGKIEPESESASHIPTKDVPHQHTQNSFLGRFYDTSLRMARRLMIGNSGLLGMAPERAMRGDLIVVLLGCSVPIVLRKSSLHAGKFTLIGECYLEGFMSGEAVKDARVTTSTFCIC